MTILVALLAGALIGWLLRHAVGHQREAQAYGRGQIEAAAAYDRSSEHFVARQRAVARKGLQ